MKYHKTFVYSSSYSQVLPHFIRVCTRIMGEITFNTKSQRFIDRHGAEMGLSYVIHQENPNKCYYFIDTSELRSEPLASFPLSYKIYIM